MQTLRLPRSITAMLVGAALGMSGAVFQSIARNPLGSPDIIGFESGAAAGAVIVIVVFHGSSTQVALGAVGRRSAHGAARLHPSPTSTASLPRASCSSVSGSASPPPRWWTT